MINKNQDDFDLVNPLMKQVSELNSLIQKKYFLEQEIKNLFKNIKIEEKDFDFETFLVDEEYQKEIIKNYFKWNNNRPWEIIFEKNKIEKLISDLSEVENNISQLKEKKEWWMNIWDAQEKYAKIILKVLLNQYRELRIWENQFKNENFSEQEQEFLKELWLDIEKILENNFWESVENQAKKLRIFKRMRTSLEKGFFLSFREANIFDEILEDMENQKPVLLTWDTGSWKTELAKFISRYYLSSIKSEHKEALFISGWRNLETEDFTIQKIIEFTNIIWESQVSEWKSENLDNIADKVIDNLNKSEELKKLILQKIWEIYEKNSEKYKEIKNLVEEWKFLDSSLTTKYHLMAILSWMKQGIPVIIDEVNTIRPEVLLSLNDLFTKKTWEEVQLPNWLNPIKVKKWFCLILTWNDPEDNKKAWKYSHWRYEFDEALYNRLSVYAKWYLNQDISNHNETDKKFSERKEEEEISSFLEEIRNLWNNELFQFIIMYIYWNNEKSHFIKWNKHWLQILKKWAWDEYLNKKDFFEEMRKFAKAISLIQKLFADEEVTLKNNPWVNLSSMINRKVFSMRNLLDVLDDYKKSNAWIEYSIFKKFIKNTSSQEEKEAVLLVFQEFDFFENEDLNSIETKFLDSSKLKQVTSSDFKNYWVIITKEDIYKEFFLTHWIEDDEIKKYKSNKNPTQIKKYSPEEIENLKSNIFESIELLEEKLDELKLDKDTTYKTLSLYKAIEDLKNNEIEFSLEELDELNQFINSLLNSDSIDNFKLLLETKLNKCSE